MARFNRAPARRGANTLPAGTTHEGAPAERMTPLQALRRSVMSCFLWERGFYESGQEIADRIEKLAEMVIKADGGYPSTVCQIANEARDGGLRHAPLLLMACAAQHATVGFAPALTGVIRRPDELAEFLAIYWRNGKKPIDHQVKRGLQMAFRKFDEYQFAKYDRDHAIKLRDVMRLVRPRPVDDVQSALFKKIVDRTLASPETWEVRLSRGEDKRKVFEEMLVKHVNGDKGGIGYFAILRNLRNMQEAGVERALVSAAISARKGARYILPFRYVAAARACPEFETELDFAMQRAVGEQMAFAGATAIVIDVSGSMEVPLSKKSTMSRMDAAAALAACFPVAAGGHGALKVWSFSNGLVRVAPRAGMALIDAVNGSQPHGGTRLGESLRQLPPGFDRLIVITDEQLHDTLPAMYGPCYMINVGVYKNGVGYDAPWVHIDGWSDNVFRFIHEYEGTGGVAGGAQVSVEAEEEEAANVE